MSEILQKIEDYIKKGNKLNEIDTKNAISILDELFNEEDKDKIIAEYMMSSLLNKVWKGFFESIFTKNKTDRIKSLLANFFETEKYNKNSGGCSIIKGFTICGILAKLGYNDALMILKKVFNDHLKKDNFSDKILDDFNTLVVRPYGVKIIQEMENSEWEKWEDKDRFAKFSVQFMNKHYKSLNDKTLAEKPEEQPIEKKTKEKENLSVVQEKQSIVKKCKVNDSPNISNSPIIKTIDKLRREIEESIYTNSEELSKINEKFDQEIQKLQNELLETKSKITSLQSIINQKNEQVRELEIKVFDTQKSNSVLETKLNNTQEELILNRKKVNELSDQLKTAIQMDGVSQNQELISLKDNLKKSLKNEYIDFKYMSNREYSEDNYKAFNASLMRIFRTLKRCGINIDDTE